MINTLSNKWLSFLIGGILMIALAIYSMLEPGVSLMTFAFIFSFVILYQGFIEVFTAISSRKLHSGWIWIFVFGLVNIFIGMYLLAYPIQSEILLGYTIIFTILFRSINAIGLALNKDGVDSWLLLLLGIAGVLFSFYLLDFPIATAGLSVYWVSFGVLLIGIYMTIFAFQIKK